MIGNKISNFIPNDNFSQMARRNQLAHTEQLSFVHSKIVSFWHKETKNKTDMNSILRQIDKVESWVINDGAVVASKETLAQVLSDIANIQEEKLISSDQLKRLIELFAYMPSSEVFRALSYFQRYRPTLLSRLLMNCVEATQFGLTDEASGRMTPQGVMIERLFQVNRMELVQAMFKSEVSQNIIKILSKFDEEARA